MNRRSFLRRFAVGTAGALMFAGTPVAVVKAACGPHATRESATAILNRCWKAATKGKSSSEMPRYIITGQSLFDAYESELIPMWRFVNAAEQAKGVRTLCYRGPTVIPVGVGYWCEARMTRPEGV